MFLNVDGLVVHVRLDGPDGAPTVLLLHSLGTCLQVWDAQAEALAARYRVVRFDMRGHGLTETTPGPYTIEGLARDARAVLDALGISRAHVAGLSIGGVIAQALASLVPDRVASLMLCDTALVVAPATIWHERAATVRAQGMGVIADAVLARWVTPDFLADPAARGLRTMLLRTDPEGYAGAALALAADDRTLATRALRLPALVVVGEQDMATPVAAAEALRDAIHGAALVVLPGAAHLPTVQLPGAVCTALTGFLDVLG